MDTSTKIYIGLIIIIIITTMGRTHIKMREELDDDLCYINDDFDMSNDELDAYYSPNNKMGVSNLRRLIREEIKADKKKKNNLDYVEAAESGIIRGCIIGFLLGDFALISGATSALVYSTVSPTLMYLGY